MPKTDFYLYKYKSIYITRIKFNTIAHKYLINKAIPYASSILKMRQTLF